jgi:protein-S-isoprenylcysteine O-methyltransferase Ste14
MGADKTHPVTMDGPSRGRPLARLAETAIVLVLPVVSHVFLPIRTVVPTPYVYLGIPVMVGGLALSSVAVQTFRRVGTPVQLQGERHSLVTTGVFRVSRNPMYLGVLVWLVGLAVFLGSATPFVFPVLLLAFVNWGLVPIEERDLMRLHGDAYAEYCRRVRRWL